MKICLAITFVAFLASYSLAAFDCTNKTGQFADPESCGRFIVCEANIVVYNGNCSAGTYYNEALGYCGDYVDGVCGSRPLCTDDFIVPNSKDCTFYNFCFSNQLFNLPCPLTLVYNHALSVCDYTNNVDINAVCSRNDLEVKTVNCSNQTENSPHLYPSAKYCTDYYKCVDGKAQWLVCASNHIFHHELLKCVKLTEYSDYFNECMSKGRLRGSD